MSEPTKRTVTKHGDGVQTGDTIEEFEAKCSVELGVLAKGEIQVKSVKVYAETEQEAGDRALAELQRLQAKIAAGIMDNFRAEAEKAAK